MSSFNPSVWRWSLETAGMKRAGSCLTLFEETAFCVSAQTLAPRRVRVKGDRGLGEEDKEVAFGGGQIMMLRETGESLTWRRDARALQVPNLGPGFMFVFAGECTLSASAKKDFEIAYRVGGDCRFTWPDASAVFQCPACRKPARVGQSRYVMAWQVLGQLLEGGGGVRVMPRLFCPGCFTGRIVESHAPLAETLEHFRDSGVGTRRGELWDAYDLSQQWMHTGFFDAFTRDFSEQTAALLGNRVSASRTAANRGSPVTAGRMKNLRQCALPSCRTLQLAQVQAGGDTLRACSKCRSAFYCSREHQLQDWKRHKKECAKIAK